jgi:hypothetical protein
MILRVTEPGIAAFQLRKGEEGLSVFDPAAVDPPLSEDEILAAFRASSVLVSVAKADVLAKGLQIVVIEGAPVLPQRLRESHAEIRPGASMSRQDFKKALKELE